MGQPDRHGFFELPAGLRFDLSFTAEYVPPLGYRTYRLRPRTDRPVFPTVVSVSATTLENAWYRLDLDPGTGHVQGWLDKDTGRELVAPDAPHPFGALVIRDPFGGERLSTCDGVCPGTKAPCLPPCACVSPRRGNCTSRRSSPCAPGRSAWMSRVTC